MLVNELLEFGIELPTRLLANCNVGVVAMVEPKTKQLVIVAPPITPLKLVGEILPKLFATKPLLDVVVVTYWSVVVVTL